MGDTNEKEEYPHVNHYQAQGIHQPQGLQDRGGGPPLTIEVGKVAELATASAMVTYGETTVLVAVTVSPRPGTRGLPSPSPWT